MDVKIEAELTERSRSPPQAAGVIHSDFRRGFIKAMIVSVDQLVEAGSMNEAKAKGWVRTEGTDYVMQDGDVVEFPLQRVNRSRRLGQG